MKELGMDEKKTLGEIADAGARDASKSLSVMCGKEVSISISWTEFYPMEEIPKTIGAVHKIVTAVYLEMSNSIDGCVLLVFPEDSALQMANLLQGREVGGTRTLDEMDISALKELGNILTNAYTKALGSAIGVSLLNSVPHLATDMINAIFGSVLSQYADRAENALIMKTGISIEKHDIRAHILIFFDPDSYALLIKKLGKCRTR